MQYRHLIQFILLLLASACFVIGLHTTLALLIVFGLVVEIIVWTRVLEQNLELE